MRNLARTCGSRGYPEAKRASITGNVQLAATRGIALANKEEDALLLV
jgi:hypothetical protein